MTNVNQVTNLVEAHVEGKDEEFRTFVLQIAAQEAREGNSDSAKKLKKLADRVKVKQLEPDIRAKSYTVTSPSIRMKDLVVTEEITEELKRILSEYRNKRKLEFYGLSHRRKILLEGPSGTGKAFTASVLASELHIPLYTVDVKKLTSETPEELESRVNNLQLKQKASFQSITTLTFYFTGYSIDF